MCNCITKLISAIFEGQGEGPVMVKLPNIAISEKALYVPFTGHPNKL